MGHQTRAAVMKGDGSLAVEQISLHDLPPGHALVRYTASVACSTDAYARLGRFPVYNAPQVRGHGGVATVVDVHPDVQTVSVDDVVLAAVRLQCGTCQYCVRGDAQWCMRSDGPPLREVKTPDGRTATDRIDYPPAPIARLSDGTALSAHARVGAFSELMCVPEICLTPTTSSVPDEQLALLTCGAGTGLGAALFEAPVEPGSSVVVHGCGVVGLSIVLAARLRGARLVLAVDPDPARRAKAVELGADVAWDPTLHDAPRRTWELTEAQGADFAFECTGSPDGVLAAYRSSRRGGAVVLTGFGAPDLTVSFSMNELAIGGRHVVGSQFGGLQVHRDLPRLIALLERGAIDLQALVEREYRLDDVDRAIEDVDDQSVLGAIIRP